MTLRSDPDSLRLGTLLRDPDASPLPLRQTRVVADLHGPVASVCVTQVFDNPFDTHVELVYLFPLPHEAAVTDFALVIGSRVVRAEIAERAKAAERYEEAVQRGDRAGLLTRERPNLFRLQVANAAPGEAIHAEVTYQQRLHWEDGQYQFLFPMGLTPRCHGVAADAGALDAPVTLDRQAVGPVTISLAVDAGAPTGEPLSPSHALRVERTDERRFAVQLAGPAIPDKDFVLRYPVAGDHVQATAWVVGGAEPAALVTALPPSLEKAGEPEPREFLFVLDRSGSMSGGPMRQALDGVRAALRALGGLDTFNILAFDDRMEWFSRRSVELTQSAVNQADRWLDQVDARGGTEIVDAIREALQLRSDPDRRRFILFLTDGSVYEENESLDLIRSHLGAARLFTFGLGPSVNRSLLSQMATLGRGTARFLQLSEDVEEAIIKFQDQVAFPVLSDLELAWEGVTPGAVYPAVLPDLYVGQPLELVARLNGPGPGRLLITGRRDGQAVRLDVPLPAAGEPNLAVERVCAKAQLDSLSLSRRSDREERIRLSVKHRILTDLTAFVAVDSEPGDKPGGRLRRVSVAVPLPEGLDFGMEMEAAPSGMPMPMMVMRQATAPPLGKSRKNGLLHGLLGAMPSSPAVAGPAPGSDDPLRVLARSQNISGSWGAYPVEVEETAAAVLAFVAAGHTTRAGHYRRQLLKAVQWLQAATPSTPAAAEARTRALGAMAEATGQTLL